MTKPKSYIPMTNEERLKRALKAVEENKIERYTRLEPDIRSGMQDRVIADKHNVSVRMVQRAKKHFGLHKPARRHSAESYEKALMLLQDGASYKDAAETVDISVEALRHKFPGYGWGKNSTQAGKHGAVMKKFHQLDKHPWGKFGVFAVRKA